MFSTNFDDLIWFEKERQAKQAIAQSGFPAFIRGLDFWGKMIPSGRDGDTGVGYTLETLLGIKENNRTEADLHGYEVKALSGPGVMTLFTRAPASHSGLSGAVGAMVQQYGTADPEGVLRLSTVLSCGTRDRSVQPTARLTMRYDAADQYLLVMDGEVIVASWPQSVLEKAATKLAKMMVCEAEKHRIEEWDHFRFTGFSLYEGFCPSLMMQAIQDGLIKVHFRASSTKGVIRDHGVAFRIKPSDLHRLYALNGRY